MKARCWSRGSRSGRRNRRRRDRDRGRARRNACQALGRVAQRAIEPELRAVVKKYAHLSLADVKKLLQSKTHEHRTAGLMVLVEQFKKAAKYTDFRELLEKEKDVNAVKVMTPDHTHATISIAALKKGKNVIVHKPLANRLLEARAVIQTARVGKIGRPGGLAEGRLSRLRERPQGEGLDTFELIGVPVAGIALELDAERAIPVGVAGVHVADDRAEAGDERDLHGPMLSRRLASSFLGHTLVP